MDIVVGVGASAGGFDAIEQVVTNLPHDTHLVLVIAQHLSPDHKSFMAQLLGRKAALALSEATDGEVLEQGHVYLVPPQANVIVSNGALHFVDRAAPHALNLPVDILFESIAAAYKERSVAVVLSGTGSDGRRGAQAIRDAGGYVLAQDPETAQFDGMPTEVIRAGLANAVLPPKQIAAELQHLAVDRDELDQLGVTTDEHARLDEIAAIVKRSTGFDLAAYKKTSVLRRIMRRVAARDTHDLDHYIDVLRTDGAESAHLVQELLISVTSFFRDAEVFAQLEARVIPDLRNRLGREAIRVWVPGCATGQEAYSLAMLLAERGGEFKIFATDVDTAALARGTAGSYSADEMVGVSPSRIERHFLRRGDRYEVEADLRNRVVFAPHDLLSDPPFTRMHLISCRNVLIYFTPEAQRRAVAGFAFGLQSGGALVLGPSEVLGDGFELFKIADATARIFTRREGPITLARSASIVPKARARVAPINTGEEEQAAQQAIRILVDAHLPASALVSRHLRVVRVFGNAGRILTVPLGSPSGDLLEMLPEPIRPVASAAIHRAYARRTTATLTLPESYTGVTQVTAHVLGTTATPFALVAFESTTAPDRPASTAYDPAQMVELERELETARKELQAATEDLETANAELQSTNEELLASNEELQATNEELQSVNEELNTLGVERQIRIGELSDANRDLDNLLDASPIATLFLDEQLRILRFNPPVTALFPLVDEDRKRPLAAFASRLDATDLIAELGTVLGLGTSIDREVRTVSGEQYLLRAVPHFATNQKVRGIVVTFTNTTTLHQARQSQLLLQSIIDGISAQIAVLDQHGTITFVNQAWLAFARDGHAGATAMVGANYLTACASVPETRAGLEAVLRRQRESFECMYPCDEPNGRKRMFHMQATRASSGDMIVVAHMETFGVRGGNDD